MKLSNYKVMKWLMALIVLTLLIPTAAMALDVRQDQDVTFVRSEETVKGPGFYFGKIVQIDGTIDGALFVAAQEIKINGVVKGDLFTASQNVQINGIVDGDVHSAAQEIQITGQINGDALTASEKLIIDKKAIIQRDAILAASQIMHAGSIQRQMLAAAKHILLSGSVNDDANLAVEDLEVQSSGSINGDLKYTGPNQANIAGDAKVVGKVNWQKVAAKVQKKETFINQLSSVLFGLAGTLILWIALTLWRPNFWQTTAVPLLERPLVSLGVGALALVFTPLLVIILLITIVGIPLGVIIGITYGIALYAAKIIVAVSVGYWLANKFGWPQLHKGVWLVLLGLSILAVMANLPVIGLFCKLLIILAGLGSLVMAYLKPTTIQ